MTDPTGRSLPSGMDATVPADLAFLKGLRPDGLARDVRDALARGLAVLDRSLVVRKDAGTTTGINAVPDGGEPSVRALSDHDHVGLQVSIERGHDLHVSAYPKRAAEHVVSISFLGRAAPPPEGADEDALRAFVRDAATLAIALLDAATDPLRALDRREGFLRLRRLGAVATHLVCSDPERRSHIAVGHTLDGPATGGVYDLTVPARERVDLLTDAQRAAWWPYPERVVMATADAADRSVCFQPLSSVVRGDLATVEALRVLADLPDPASAGTERKDRP